MIADLGASLPIALLLGWFAWGGFGPRDSSRLRAAAVAGLAALVAAGGWTYAFDGYKSDLWVYLTVVERVADGEWLLDREPFWLEPPGGPHHSLNWIVLGILSRVSDLSPHFLVRALRIASLGFLTFGAYRLAARAFRDDASRWLAVLLFWGAIPQLWTEIGINRTFSLAYLLLAVTLVLELSASRRQVAALAACVALAFFTHFFTGLLTLGAIGLAATARVFERDEPPLVHLTAGIVAGLALASPWIATYLVKGGLPVADAYLWGPGQHAWGDWRWLSPFQLLREISPPVLAAFALGLFTPARDRLTPRARRLSALGAAAVFSVLFTPAYHFFSEHLGGWLALRLLALGFFWIPAAAGVAWLLADDRRARRAAGALLLFAMFWLGAARVTRDARHAELHLAFAPTAQAEARGLRELLRGRTYLSSADLAYGLAAGTLGRPLPVTPGRASPFHPFTERQRETQAALRANSGDCWVALFRRHPHIEFLVTPAPGAAAERAVWRNNVPTTQPESVRDSLRALGPFETVHHGKHFLVDRIAIPSATDGACAALADPERVVP